MRLDVCFIGIGSIAKRHIKNLREICNESGIELHVDALRHKKGMIQENEQLGIEKCYSQYDEVKKQYDVVFITNPTEMHLETINQSRGFGKNFFIEKPVVSYDQIQDIGEMHLNKDAVSYVACPLRYNAVIQYIKDNIDLSEVISVRSISSSYLPEWRAGIDYRNTYSAHKAMGGGVSIDLIHEWDYLTYLFGKPQKLYWIAGKKSKLEIDSEDYALYLADYKDKTVELHLDYFGRKIIREVTLFTNEDTIIGDIAQNKITFLKSGKEIDFQEERDDFQKRELRHFLKMILDGIENDSTVEHAVDVLKITQGRIS